MISDKHFFLLLSLDLKPILFTFSNYYLLGFCTIKPSLGFYTIILYSCLHFSVILPQVYLYYLLNFFIPWPLFFCTNDSCLVSLPPVFLLLPTFFFTFPYFYTILPPVFVFCWFSWAPWFPDLLSLCFPAGDWPLPEQPPDRTCQPQGLHIISNKVRENNIDGPEMR